MTFLIAVTEAEVAGWGLTGAAIVTTFFVLLNLIEKKAMALALQFAEDKAKLQAMAETANANAKDSKGIALNAATKADIANITAITANALATANKEAIGTATINTSAAIKDLRSTANTHDNQLTMLASMVPPPIDPASMARSVVAPPPEDLGLKHVNF